MTRSKGRPLRPELLRIDGRAGRGVHLLLSALAFGAVLAAWALTTAVGSVPDIYLPSIGAVAGALRDAAADGTLAGDLGISLTRILVAFALAAVVAVPLGLLAGRIRLADALITPLAEFARYLPVVAFVPLTIIWAGTEESQKYLVIWIGTFFPLLLMVIDDVRRVGADLVDFGRTLGMTDGRILRRIVMRGALPGIVDSLRISLGWCWTWLVVGELVAATSGLGYRITIGQRYLETELIFAYILVLGVVGLLSDQALRLLHRTLFPYLRESGR
ncbi:ABC transporter permease [Actinoplanes sp. NPDC051851]|uniref:ABC transporter permease n=1 Tax=Actinoplanes sp. NPDC051851 TaxID=3154753 RepID=UPI003448A707